MRFRVPAWWDGLMDTIALILFPSRKYLGITLVIYFCLITAGLVWYTTNWLWVIATPICAAMAYMFLAWFL